MMLRGELLREGRSILRAAGIQNPRREAAWILADLEQGSGVNLLLASEMEVDPGLVSSYRSLMTRRVAGEPLAYVTGWAAFRHLQLRVDRRVLIPRPETEGLVDRVLESSFEAGSPLLDVGTGSGCLVLSLGSEGADRFGRLTAVDRSWEALYVARENAIATGLSVRYLAGDLTEAVRDASIGVLVANPPYLTEDEFTRADPGVTRWEPREALVGGADGLDCYRALLDDARRVVVPGGLLGLELDATRAETVGAMARELGWGDVSVHWDLFGRARYLLARRGRAS